MRLVLEAQMWQYIREAGAVAGEFTDGDVTRHVTRVPGRRAK
jgi:hypothetical protein